MEELLKHKVFKYKQQLEKENMNPLELQHNQDKKNNNPDFFIKSTTNTIDMFDCDGISSFERIGSTNYDSTIDMYTVLIHAKNTKHHDILIKYKYEFTIEDEDGENIQYHNIIEILVYNGFIYNENNEIVFKTMNCFTKTVYQSDIFSEYNKFNIFQKMSNIQKYLFLKIHYSHYSNLHQSVFSIKEEQLIITPFLYNDLTKYIKIKNKHNNNIIKMIINKKLDVYIY